jgi:hypothetical protein
VLQWRKLGSTRNQRNQQQRWKGIRLLTSESKNKWWRKSSEMNLSLCIYRMPNASSSVTRPLPKRYAPCSLKRWINITVQNERIQRFRFISLGNEKACRRRATHTCTENEATHGLHPYVMIASLRSWHTWQHQKKCPSLQTSLRFPRVTL